jgi:putative transposase
MDIEKLNSPKPLAYYSDKWTLAIHRQFIIRRLALKSKITKADFEQASGELGLCVRQVRNILADYRNVPVLQTCMPGHRVSPARKRRIPNETLKIIWEVIKKDYLGTKEKRFISTIHASVRCRCLELGVYVPSYSIVKRELDKVPDLEKAKANKISKPPEACQIYTGRHPATGLLEYVQIDHTHVDLICDHRDIGLWKRRIYITLAECVASRMVYGYYLSLRPPSTRHSALTLMLGMLPKRQWVQNVGLSYSEFREKGIVDPWPIMGACKIAQSDRAADFRGYSYRQGVLSMGVQEIQYRPKGKCWFGGHIERLIGTFMKQVHELPGTTFSNVQQRGRYNSEKHALLTLADFETWLVALILEYHLASHRGLQGLTPLQKFEELKAQGHNKHLKLLPDLYDVYAAFLPHKPRTIGDTGITLNKRFYMHDRLRGMRGKKLIVKYHPHRNDVVYVCLDGMRPSFEAACYYDPNVLDGQREPLDPEYNSFIKAETKRQNDIARDLNAQRHEFIDNLKKARSKELSVSKGSSRAKTILPTGRPIPSLPGNNSPW